MPRLLCSLLLAGLAACYQPSYEEGVACGPGGSCPDGLSCRSDNRCRRGADPADSGVPRDASAGALADAAPISCVGDGECQVPPTLCQLPGTCDLEAGACVFPAVDCSSLDGDCARGACDLATGSCTAEPIDEEALCGDGEVCGEFGPCAPDGVGDVCDTTGVQSRVCVVSTCRAGQCIADEVPGSASCTLDTTGAECGADTVVCGQCLFIGECDETGTASCTCTSYACAGGACAPSSQGCEQECTRETDGLPCLNGTCFSGQCFQEPDPCPFPPCPLPPIRR